MFVIPAPNPVAFSLFGIPVYKYGITMALAIFVAMVVANWLYNKNTADVPEIRKDVIIEYAPIIILAGILGARLYFCTLNASFYFTHPLEILDIRQGGLSIHGAILGGALSLYFIAKKAKVSFAALIDSLAGSIFAGQAIGRWGNYFNSEAFGVPVNGQNWGLFIPQNLRPGGYENFNLFHPTFLYESCLDFIGFLVILLVITRFGKSHKGLTSFVYLILYSVIRFIIEDIRLDSALNIGSVPFAQIISAILFVVGVVGLLWTLFKK